jgi:hypothetical protein
MSNTKKQDARGLLSTAQNASFGEVWRKPINLKDLNI